MAFLPPLSYLRLELHQLPLSVPEYSNQTEECGQEHKHSTPNAQLQVTHLYSRNDRDIIENVASAAPVASN